MSAPRILAQPINPDLPTTRVGEDLRRSVLEALRNGGYDDTGPWTSKDGQRPMTVPVRLVSKDEGLPGIGFRPYETSLKGDDLIACAISALCAPCWTTEDLEHGFETARAIAASFPGLDRTVLRIEMHSPTPWSDARISTRDGMFRPSTSMDVPADPSLPTDHMVSVSRNVQGPFNRMIVIQPHVHSFKPKEMPDALEMLRILGRGIGR